MVNVETGSEGPLLLGWKASVDTETEKKPRGGAIKPALGLVSSVAAKKIVPNAEAGVAQQLVGGVSSGGWWKVSRIKVTLISPRGYCSNIQ